MVTIEDPLAITADREARYAGTDPPVEEDVVVSPAVCVQQGHRALQSASLPEVDHGPDRGDGGETVLEDAGEAIHEIAISRPPDGIDAREVEAQQSAEVVDERLDEGDVGIAAGQVDLAVLLRRRRC
jgi:hypothetical protein